VALSDRSRDRLDLESLRLSELDGAFLCTVKRALVSGGLPARFTHAAQAELLSAVDDGADGPVIRIGGRLLPMPQLHRVAPDPGDSPGEGVPDGPPRGDGEGVVR
jgi:hypothetical protein